MFGHHVWQKPNSISEETPHTSSQAQWWRADDLGWFCSHRTWTPCRHWVHHELLCIPKSSRVKYEANLQQNVRKRKESRCCNGPVQVQTWNLIEMLWRNLKVTVQESQPTSTNTPTQMWKSDNIIQKSYCCQRWFYKLLNKGGDSEYMPDCSCYTWEISSNSKIRQYMWAYKQH